MEQLISALEELFIKYNVDEEDIVLIEDAINNLNAVEPIEDEYEDEYTEDEGGYEEDYESDYE